MIMSIQLDYTEKTCVTCGCVYYVPTNVVRVRNENKESFYCFNGHSQSAIKSTSQKLREEYDSQITAKDQQIQCLNNRIGRLVNKIEEIEKPAIPIKRRAKRVTR